MRGKLVPIILILVLFSCKSSRRQNLYQPMFKPGPPLIVYKTKKDYSKLVPVRMDSTKTFIESYPAPSDVMRDGKPILPLALKKGYWLDNIGIGKNVAYLKFTIEEYANFSPEKVTDDFLLASILEKEPLLELWYGGVKELKDSLVEQLNASISMSLNNTNFKRLK